MDAHCSNRGGIRTSGGTGALGAETNVSIKKQLTHAIRIFL